MNHRSYSEHHAVYLVDLELPLTEMLMVLADHCDEEKMYTPKDVLMLAIHLLMTQHNLGEACEAMEIDVSTFCVYKRNPYTEQRIKYAIESFLREMQRLFEFYGFYSDEGFLKYTFGGWHGEYTPVFIPYSHIQCWPQAISAIVGGEPLDPHPSKVFHYPFPAETADPFLPF